MNLFNIDEVYSPAEQRELSCSTVVNTLSIEGIFHCVICPNKPKYILDNGDWLTEFYTCEEHKE